MLKNVAYSCGIEKTRVFVHFSSCLFILVFRIFKKVYWFAVLLQFVLIYIFNHCLPAILGALFRIESFCAQVKKAISDFFIFWKAGALHFGVKKNKLRKRTKERMKKNKLKRQEKEKKIRKWEEEKKNNKKVVKQKSAKPKKNENWKKKK